MTEPCLMQHQLHRTCQAISTSTRNDDDQGGELFLAIIALSIQLFLSYIQPRGVLY